MDAAWRDAERRWRADPSDLSLVALAFTCARRAGVRPPPDLLGALPRWTRLAGFLVKWTGRPLREEDGVGPERLAAIEQRLGAALPAALRECHELAGKVLQREDLGHVHLHSLEYIDPEAEFVTVAWDTEGVFGWGIRNRDDDDDPRTIVWHEGETDREAGVRVSELAIQVAMLQRLMGPDGVGGTLHPRERPPWPLLPVPPMHWGPRERMHFFGDGDTIVGAFFGGEYAGAFHLACRTPSLVAAARRRVEGQCTWNAGD